jgi:hypothetical protein
MKGEKQMKFAEALEALKCGAAVKRPHWAGYWMLEGGALIMYLKDGTNMDLRETQDTVYTMEQMAAEDWEVPDDVPWKLDIQTFRFGEAIRRMKAGQKVARRGWNGRGMFVVYQKGYPQGIPCNKQTAEAWGMNEGDLFICNPYLQIKQVDGSHSMWVPSIGDVLAEDWVEVRL